MRHYFSKIVLGEWNELNNEGGGAGTVEDFETKLDPFFTNGGVEYGRGSLVRP